MFLFIIFLFLDFYLTKIIAVIKFIAFLFEKKNDLYSKKTDLYFKTNIFILKQKL